MLLRLLHKLASTLMLVSLLGIAAASSELSSGQAGLLGAFMVLAPVLLVAGFALIAALVFAPAVIRAVRPASTTRVKWLVVAALAGIEFLWVFLRAPTFFSQVFKAHFIPELLDGLLVVAWGLLVFSLLKHRPALVE